MTTRIGPLTATPPSTRRTAVILHGILGAGRNWRGFARRWVEAAPDWSCVLVDQRGHGEAPSRPPPHDLAACAADLDLLAPGAEVVVGHSFGGKVALARAAARPPGLRQVWVLDAAPGPSSAREASAVLRIVSDLAMPAASRAEVRERLEGAGLSPTLAAWLLTSLVQRGEQWEWCYDLPTIHALVADYRARDLWPVVESPPPGVEVHLVRATRSPVWDDAQLARARSSPARVHELRDAGHWLHVENPDGLLAMMSEAFRPGARAPQ